MTADEMRKDWRAASKWVWQCMEEKGFHDVGVVDEQTMKSARIALVHTEIAEATQEIKRHWTSEPSEELKDKIAEELADVVIRVLDYASCHHANDLLVPRSEWPVLKVSRIGLLSEMESLHHDASLIVRGATLSESYYCGQVICTCKILCDAIARDLFVSVEKKMAKNMARPHRYGTPDAKG